MDSLTFKLELFEGPLDLLLHLVSKNKVDLNNIPISEILTQYMEYLDGLKAFDIDVSSEFTVMAAQLMYIKSRMILPVYEDENEEDPRKQLVDALIEYQLYKSLRPYFEEQSVSSADIYIKTAEPVEKDTSYEYSHSVKDLETAILALLEKNESRIPPTAESVLSVFGGETVSIEHKIRQLLEMFKTKTSLSFREIFAGAKTRGELVVSFLAILELCLDRHVTIIETSSGCSLKLTGTPDVASVTKRGLWS